VPYAKDTAQQLLTPSVHLTSQGRSPFYGCLEFMERIPFAAPPCAHWERERTFLRQGSNRRPGIAPSDTAEHTVNSRYGDQQSNERQHKAPCRPTPYRGTPALLQRPHQRTQLEPRASELEV